MTSIANTVGTFNYLADTVEHSLYRNGAVLTRRDRDGSDAGTEGVNLTEHNMSVANARLLDASQQRTLAKHGFELLSSPLQNDNLDFFNHEQVVREYYPQCAEIIQAQTGATRVFAFDHNIRSATGKESKKRIAGGQQVQGPAHIVHGDYTLTSAPQRLRDLANPPKANDTFSLMLNEGETLVKNEWVEQALSESGRFAIINVWRNITEDPVVTVPLALCDSQTVRLEDLVVFEIHYHDRIGENYFAKNTPQHAWYYYPEMTKDEALLIKQWDSAGGVSEIERYAC